MKTKITNNQSGMGMIAIVIIIGILLVVTAAFFRIWEDGKHNVNDYHETLRTMSLSENYEKHCTELKEVVSMAAYKPFYDEYRQLTTDTINFNVENHLFDISEYRERNTRSIDGVTYAAQYESGNAQIGVVLKNTSDGYCVLAEQWVPLQ